MHGFPASREKCDFGMVLHLVSFALAGAALGIVLLLA